MKGLYFLPPGVDFAAEAVRGLLERFRDRPPEALAQATVYANSGRTLTALRERLIAAGPLLMPRLRLIAELGEGPLASPLARELDLGALITRLVAAHPGLTAGQAVPALARSLAALMEEMQREGCGPDSLGRIDVAEHAEHWRTAQAFLAIAADWYLTGPPQDRAARQRAAAEAAVRDWPAGVNLPAGPVIVAGSTGSHGATRLFMQAVAALPEGAVILPGFDSHQPPDALLDLHGDDHPQARFAPLVAASGMPRPWTGAAPAAPARNRLVSLALRPAPVTDRWIAEGPELGDLLLAAEGLALIEADDPQAEAEALALAIRDAVGRGEAVTLIAADRLLTRRVTAALDRWRLIPDDSAGQPLSLTPPGLLLRQTADLFGQTLMLDGLIALLKHPLTARGWETGGGDHLRLTRDLELDLRRSGPAFPDAAFLRRWPEERQRRKSRTDGTDAMRAAWAEWLAGVLEAIGPLAGDRAPRPLPARLASHMALTEALAAGPGGAVSALWEGEDGGLARAVMEQLGRHARDRHLLTPRDYGELLLGQLQAQALRRGAEAHPLIRIRGPREARTEATGLVLLAGLNEDGWPQAPAPDPWLSRQMRRQAGLTPPERLTGLAAHDFQQGIAAGTVILSRAARDAEAETVPARWLNRLTNLLEGLPAQNGPEALEAMRARGQQWRDLAVRLAMPPVARVPAAPRPAPVPPPGALHDISVTQVAGLIRDPYAVYARKVLRLRPLDPLRAEPDASLRGTVLHEIVRQFLTPPPPAGTTAEALAERFLEVAKRVLDTDVPWPIARAFWMARLATIAPQLMRDEAQRLNAGAPKLVEEAATVPLEGLGIRLTAKPDRIDIENDGRVRIYDYKSGHMPTNGEIEAFDKQLPLTAAMVMRGAFPSIAAREVAGISYINLGKDGRTGPRDFTPDLATTTWERLIELLARYQSGGAGFLSLAAPQLSKYAGDYDHLARRGEWSLADPAVPQPVGWEDRG